jgi:hypothetical protein
MKFCTHFKVMSHLDRVYELVENADDLEVEEVRAIRLRLEAVLAALETVK